MGTKLPRKLEQKMQIVGEQIRLARLRRNLSIAQVAERATCSPLTVLLYFMISYGNQFSNLFLLKTALVTLLSVEILSAIILFIRLIFYR